MERHLRLGAVPDAKSILFFTKAGDFHLIRVLRVRRDSCCPGAGPNPVSSCSHRLTYTAGAESYRPCVDWAAVSTQTSMPGSKKVEYG